MEREFIMATHYFAEISYSETLTRYPYLSSLPVLADSKSEAVAMFEKQFINNDASGWVSATLLRVEGMERKEEAERLLTISRPELTAYKAEADYYHTALADDKFAKFEIYRNPEFQSGIFTSRAKKNLIEFYQFCAFFARSFKKSVIG
jgi:hypothetical protein